MTRLKGIVDLLKPITKQEAYNYYKKKSSESLEAKKEGKKKLLRKEKKGKE
jgi:hypothetical protein